MFFAIVARAVPAGAAKTAQVEVGFVGTPPPGFQNVLLNVQAVRINKKANASPTGGGWQKIPTPPGIGNQNQFAELQIDLNASQNIPQLFNTSDVKKNTYHTAEILLDPNNPGFLVPNCPQAFSRLEGCINYPIALNNGNVILVTDTSNTGLISPGKNNLGILVLQLAVMVNLAPVNPGGAFLVTITLNTVPNPTVPNSLLAPITGQVTVNSPGPGTGTTVKIRKLTVTAESIGTNTAIATGRVQSGGMNPVTMTNCPPSPGGCFTLALPAAAGFGTLYDFAVAGGSNTYKAERYLPVFPGQTQPAALAFTVMGNQTLGSITGEVKDICTGDPIIGATLQLLIPPDSNSGADCTTNPEQCVTVASANTGPEGAFPLPGTLTVPAQFANVPVLPKNAPYVMNVTAPGYDTQIVLVKPSAANKKNGGTCMAEGATTFTTCNILMNTGVITGTIPIIPPKPGEITEVEVFAEDSTTNNIEAALPMPLKVTNSNVAPCPGNPMVSCITFNLKVPTSATVPIPTGGTIPVLDLFASTMGLDTYQGIADPYQGHNIVVLSNVAAPPPAPGPGMCSSNSTLNANFSVADPINCIGHGSITGTVAVPNLGTSVILSKRDPESMQDVQLTNSIVQNQSPNPDPSNNYSFCAPADTYDVQRFQLPTPIADMTPSAMPTPEPDGAPTSVTIPPAPVINGPSPTPSGSPTPTATPTGPTPTATSTPTIKCPTTCSSAGGGCPGTCNNVFQTIP
jgi:hypothetical protein